jgi:hypothetical protein
MANTKKRNSTVKYSRVNVDSYSDVGKGKYHPSYASKYKERPMSKLDMFLKDESTERMAPSPGAQTIAWGLRTKPGKEMVKKGKKAIAETKEFGRTAVAEYKDIAESAVRGGKAAKTYAVIKGKLAIGKAKYYGEEVGEVGVKVGEAGIKGGKWYTKKLPKQLVDEAARFSTEAPADTPKGVFKQTIGNQYKIVKDIPLIGKRIDKGVGFGSRKARAAAVASREMATKAYAGVKESKAVQTGKKTYFKGKRAASSIDTGLSSAGYRAAPDQLLKRGISWGAGTKTGQQIARSKQAKYIGAKAEYVKSSRLGKFVGGSETAMKVREARGKLSYARQHKVASTMKLGKFGAKKSAGFALANANFASNLIAQQDGVLAIFKPLFWSLKLVPFMTSAIVPIIVVVITTLVMMMVLMCGWVSFAFLLYFLKSLPCIVINVFMTIGNAIFFSFFAVMTLIQKGFQDILNSVFYFFLQPILDPLNNLWRTLDNIPLIGGAVPNYNDATRLKFIPMGYTQFGDTPGYYYRQGINATPDKCLAYLVPKPIEFNLDVGSLFYGWPTGGSMIAFAWVKPGVPLYLTDDHGNYLLQRIETGNMVKLDIPALNPWAINEEVVEGVHRDKGIIADYEGINRVYDWWNITWDDEIKGTGRIKTDKAIEVFEIVNQTTGHTEKRTVYITQWGVTASAVGHWTFIDHFSGTVGRLYDALKYKFTVDQTTGVVTQEDPLTYPMRLLTNPEVLLGVAATKQAALKNAALQGDKYGFKQQVYNNNGIPWANAPEDLEDRVRKTSEETGVDVLYYVRGHGYCVIYNTNPYTTTTVVSGQLGGGLFGWLTTPFTKLWQGLNLMPKQEPITTIKTEDGDIYQTTHALPYNGSEDIRYQGYAPNMEKGNYAEGNGTLAPDYIFGGEPFFVDQEVMKAMRLGRYADEWETRYRLWIIYQFVDGELVQLAQGDDGNLYPYEQVQDLYFKQLAESGIIQLDYSLPGG